jgi:hypothetical protein
MVNRVWYSLSAVDFAVGVLFLLFALIAVAFGHEDIGRVLAGSSTTGDIASLVLLVGWGVSGVVLFWAGMAAVGDRSRLALAAQIVSMPLVLIGTGLIMWALCESRLAAATPFLLLAVLVFLGAEGIACVAISSLALRVGRRSSSDPALTQRLRDEGPTVAVLQGFTVRGDTLAPFRVAYVGYRMGAVIMALLHVSLFVPPVLVIGAARLAWSRGELPTPSWPPTVGGTLAALLVLLFSTYLAWCPVYGGRQVLKFCAIHRRTALFPDGLAYAHRVVWQMDNAWLSVPPPCADRVADKLHAWSARLLRVEEPLRTVSILLGPVLFVVVIILITQGHLR